MDIITTTSGTNSVDQAPLPRSGGQIVTNSAFNAVRLLITSAAGLVTSSVIARTLGPDETGRYAYAVWIGALLLSVSHGGIPTTMTRFIAEASARGERDTSRSLFTRLVVWQVLIAVVVCGGAACILTMTHPDRRMLYIIAIAMVLPQVLQQAANGALTGLQRFDQIAMITGAGTLLNVVAVIMAVVLKAGAVGILASVLLATALSACLSLGVLNKTLHQGIRDASIDKLPKADRYQSMMPRVRWFSLTVWYLVLLDLVVWDRSEIFFLRRYSAISQVAVYSIAFMLVCKVWEAASSVSATLAPLSADAVGRSEPERVGSIFRAATRYIHLLLVPISILGIGLSKPIVLLVYGKQYLAVIPVLQILLIVPVLMTLTEAAVATVYALERQAFLALALTPTCLLNLFLAWALVPRYGAVGAATASTIAQLLETIVVVWYAARISNAGVLISAVLRVWICAVCAAVPCLLSSSYGAGMIVTASLSLCGIAIFLGLLVSMREIGSVEFLLLKSALLQFVNRLRPTRA